MRIGGNWDKGTGNVKFKTVFIKKTAIPIKVMIKEKKHKDGYD